MDLSRKSTTQDAPLERYLAHRRVQRVLNHVANKRVLDFGCGLNAWAGNLIAPKAALVHGVDASASNETCFPSGMRVFRALEDLPRSDYEVVIALAVFEHIEPFSLITILGHLEKVTDCNAMIIGTVPTPMSRALLEFLSYKLRLIDASQIEDHKVYYDDLWLGQIISRTNWSVNAYKQFQFGLNSEFRLARN